MAFARKELGLIWGARLSWHVSLSDEVDSAVAFVVIEQNVDPLPDAAAEVPGAGPES